MDVLSFLPSFLKSEYSLAFALVGLLALAAGLYFVKRWMSKEPIQSVPPEISAAVSSSLAPEGPPSGESGESSESGESGTFEA